MIKILLFFSLLEMIFSLDWRFYLNQRSSSIKMEDIWVEINNNVITFDRYCIFGVARKSRIDWCLGAREQERERERWKSLHSIRIHKQRIQHACIHVLGRTREADPRNWILLERIDRRWLLRRFCVFFFFPSLSLVHGRCSSASRGSHDKSFLSN